MTIFVRYRQGGSNQTAVLDTPGSFASGDGTVAYDGSTVVVTANDIIDVVGVLVYDVPVSPENQSAIIAMDPWNWDTLAYTERVIPQTAAIDVTPGRVVPQSAAIRATETRSIPQAVRVLIGNNTRTVVQRLVVAVSGLTRTVPMAGAISSIGTGIRTITQRVAIKTIHIRTVIQRTAVKVTGSRTVIQRATVSDSGAATPLIWPRDATVVLVDDEPATMITVEYRTAYGSTYEVPYAEGVVVDDSPATAITVHSTPEV